MNRRNFISAVLAGGATSSLSALAGCSGGGGTSSTSASSTSSTSSQSSTGGGSPTVSVRSTGTYGDILVDSNGMSLYLLTNDTKGSNSSTCTGNCATYWPPVTVSSSPTRGDNVTASLGTFKRADGSTQVTAAGWPLYTFKSDSSPGDTQGQAVSSYGGTWYLLAPDGSPITASKSSPSTSSGSY